MGETIEGMDEEIELKDRTSNFLLDKKGASLVGTLKQMEKKLTEIMNETNRVRKK